MDFYHRVLLCATGTDVFFRKSDITTKAAFGADQVWFLFLRNGFVKKPFLNGNLFF
jgi:hypothetical protein